MFSSNEHEILKEFAASLDIYIYIREDYMAVRAFKVRIFQKSIEWH